ncbi:hypothetical protein [Corynebacterium lizhenjunii]|uniref:hypothetical protein n=1 Tax=Corynebacterium lizhenjunii TaxID=2709394 RepID=UPI0013EA337B|nr:hypothetical protein [Corynebacterium lizhenjunii]
MSTRMSPARREVRLWFGVVDKYSLVVVPFFGLLWGIGTADAAPLWQWLFATVLLIMVTMPKLNSKAIVALGITRRQEHLYKVILAVLTFASGAVGLFIAGSPLLVLPALAALMWVVIHPPRNSERDASRGTDEERKAELLAHSDGRDSFGRLPATPLVQLVVRPLWWRLPVLWAVVLVALGVAELLQHFAIADGILKIIFFGVLFTQYALLGNDSDTLRDYVHFGGTRREWTTAVVGIHLLGMACGFVVLAVVALWTGAWPMGLTVIVLMLPTLLTTLGLQPASLRWSWLLGVFFLVVGAAAFYYTQIWDGSQLVGLGIALVAVVAWVPTTFYLARTYDTSAPTFADWFGLS